MLGSRPGSRVSCKTNCAGCILPASSLTPSAAFALGGGSCATRHASRPPIALLCRA